MQLSFLLVTLSWLVVTVRSQSQVVLPDCATKCLGSAFTKGTTCKTTDIACICADTALQAEIEGCVLTTCHIKDALLAKRWSSESCNLPVRDITHIAPIVTGISGGLALLAVIIRCIQANSLRYPDTICAIIAICFAVPMGVLEFIMSHDGFGKDIWMLEPDKITRIVYNTWLTEIFYFVAIAATKMSFLFLYLRIFPDPRLRMIINGMLAFSVAYGISFVVTCIFNCIPVSYIWNKWHGEATGTCINFNAFAWAHAAINIASDIAIIGLPIPELLKLNMSRKKKFYVVIMFSIGFFITIISIIRLQSLVEFATTANPTWDAVPTAYWSVLECYVAIICVCLPAIRILLARILPSCFAASSVEYEETPIKSSRRTPKRKSDLDFTITKTIDATVTSVPRDVENGEDGLQLVDFGGRGTWDDRPTGVATRVSRDDGSRESRTSHS